MSYKFLPHNITIIQTTVVVVDGESRYERTLIGPVKAMVYKKEKDTLVDGNKRDDDKEQYQVIIKQNLPIQSGDIIVPNL